MHTLLQNTSGRKVQETTPWMTSESFEDVSRVRMSSLCGSRACVRVQPKEVRFAGVFAGDGGT